MHFGEQVTESTVLQPPSRVLVVSASESQDSADLVDYLSALGWRVETFDPAPRGDSRHTERGLPLLGGVAMAIILISGPEAEDSALQRRLLLVSGELKGVLGARSMLALVEDDAGPVLADTDIAEIRYNRDDIESRLPRVVSRLGQGPLGLADAARPTGMVTPWPERFGVTNGRVPAEILVALGLVAVVFSVVAVIWYQFFDSERGPLAAEVAGTGSVATTEPPTSGSGGSFSTIAPGGDGGLDRALGPADAGSLAGLPARCVVETPKGRQFEGPIACDEGVGGIEFRGSPGPWHNEIAEIVTEPGVLGEVAMEPRSGRSTAEVVELASGGASDLAIHGSAFGIERLTFVFTANGQEVLLRPLTGQEGDIATLVYRLDLG